MRTIPRRRRRRIAGLGARRLRRVATGAGCRSHRPRQPADGVRSAAIGAGEGALNLVIWTGYARARRERPGLRLGHAVRDGDRLQGHHDQDGTDSANMVQLMQTGEYDGVSASGDATLRLIAGGDVVADQLRT